MKDGKKVEEEGEAGRHSNPGYSVRRSKMIYTNGEAVMTARPEIVAGTEFRRKHRAPNGTTEIAETISCSRKSHMSIAMTIASSWRDHRIAQNFILHFH